MKFYDIFINVYIYKLIIPCSTRESNININFSKNYIIRFKDNFLVYLALNNKKIKYINKNFI